MFRFNITIFAFLHAITGITALPNPIQLESRDTGATAATVASIPINRNAVYAQTVSGGLLPPLVDEQTGITHVILAAFHITGTPPNVVIHLNDYPPSDPMFDQVWADVKYIQSKGVKVLAMLGGAAQGSYTVLENNSTFSDYFDPFVAVLQNYNLDGCDLDIEEEIDVTTALKTLQYLDTKMGPNFLLTMAPVASALIPLYGDVENVSGFDYQELDAMATSETRPNKKLVSWYHAQFYNGWGDSSSQIYYDILALTNVKPLSYIDPSRISMGILDSSADGGSGWYSISTYQSVIKQLRANFPTDFGGIVGWEYFNAGTNDGLSAPWQWVQEINAALTAPTSGLPAANKATTPLVQPQVPWPAEAATLASQGAPYPLNVYALNTTDGNLPAAQKLLGIKSGS